MFQSPGFLSFAVLLALFSQQACSARATCNDPTAYENQRVVYAEPGINFMDQLNEFEAVLTFDDGPVPDQTGKVLNELAKKCERATFFLRGDSATWQPDMVSEIIERGHTVGSHGWAHTDLTTLSIEDALADAQKARQAIESALVNTPYSDQVPVRMFRFPFLRTTPELSTALLEAGLIDVPATSQGNDWLEISAEEVVERLMTGLAQTGNKGVLLLHDPFPGSMMRTRLLLERLEADGYDIVVLKTK